MSQAPLLKTAAPSSLLLRFLRSQSDNIWTATRRPGSRQCIREGQSKAGQQTRPASVRCLSVLGHCRRPVASSSTLSPLCSTTLAARLHPKHLRRSSTDGSPWFPSLFGRRKKRESTRSDDVRPLTRFIGEGTDGSMLSSGRSKASNELKLRCTEFDENGKVTLVNGEFKKSELIAKYGLLPRDLRKIDSSLLPNVLVRESAILINLLHIRALIKHNRVLVFDAYGSTDSYTQSVFMYDLEGKLRQREESRQAGGLAYEFRALEAVLISVTSALESEFEGVRGPVVQVLRELEEDIDRDKLRYLLVYSKKLGTFEQKAKLVRDAIDELLEADDDLAAMYLTEKARGGKRGEDDHTEVELLLESYHKVCDEIVQVSGNLVSNIRNTEEIVKAILDANRNSLILLDLKFSIGTLGIGGGAFIAGLYGMNLKNFLEESDLGFVGVSGFSLLLAALICAYGLTKLRKVQRVSIWGEQGRRGWRHLDTLPPLPPPSPPPPPPPPPAPPSSSSSLGAVPPLSSTSAAAGRGRERERN